MSLSWLYARLQEKQEHLARLNTCNSQLNGCQSEFNSQKYLCIDPPLAVHTWQGSLANEFEQIREGGIQVAYQDIQTNQFNRVFQVIEDKITEIQLEISSIKHDIAVEKARIEREEREAREAQVAH